MATAKAGAYSRLLGTLQTRIWGVARTRHGKIMSARGPGPDPYPVSQEIIDHRAIVHQLLILEKWITNDSWRIDWDKSAGKLPGWHSMMSWWISNCSYTALHVETLTDLLHHGKSLGSVHMPVVLPTSPLTGTLILTWNTISYPPSSSPDDVLRGCTVFHQDPGTNISYCRMIAEGIKRSAGAYSWAGLHPASRYTTIAWFRHTDGARVTFSPVEYRNCQVL